MWSAPHTAAGWDQVPGTLTHWGPHTSRVTTANAPPAPAASDNRDRHCPHHTRACKRRATSPGHSILGIYSAQHPSKHAPEMEARENPWPQTGKDGGKTIQQQKGSEQRHAGLRGRRWAVGGGQCRLRSRPSTQLCLLSRKPVPHNVYKTARLGSHTMALQA